MTAVRLLPEAEFDIAEAAMYLEARVPGLGSRLADQVDHAIQILQENPYAGADVEGGARKLVVRRFPYNLIYRVLSDHVLILALAHHARRPGYWQNRG
jgi:toxin ParE1/3/4